MVVYLRNGATSRYVNNGENATFFAGKKWCEREDLNLQKCASETHAYASSATLANLWAVYPKRSTLSIWQLGHGYKVARPSFWY